MSRFDHNLGIDASGHRHDKSDAVLLARLGCFDPTLLAPVHHRSKSAQFDLACQRARDMLVSARTDLINHVRGTLKPFGPLY